MRRRQKVIQTHLPPLATPVEHTLSLDPNENLSGRALTAAVTCSPKAHRPQRGERVMRFDNKSSACHRRASSASIVSPLDARVTSRANRKLVCPYARNQGVPALRARCGRDAQEVVRTSTCQHGPPRQRSRGTSNCWMKLSAVCRRRLRSFELRTFEREGLGR